MKKVLSYFLIFIVTLCLVACGSEPEPKNSEPLSEEEFTSFYEKPPSFKGRTVENFPVVIAQTVGEENGGFLYRSYADQDYTNDIALKNKESMDVSEGDYVLINGEISGTYTYTSVMNAEITLPLITVNSFEKSDSSILNKAVEVIEVGKTKKQKKISVTLDRVELAENSTRVYFTIKNGSSDKITIYTFNSFIMQGSTQFDESDISYEENTLKTDLNKGSESSGCLSFEKMDNLNDFTVSLEISSDDYEMELKPFEFKVTK